MKQQTQGHHPAEAELWIQDENGTARCTYLGLKAKARPIVEQMIQGRNTRRQEAETPPLFTDLTEVEYEAQWVDATRNEHG